MAAPSLAPSFDSASRRHVFRCPINVPVDVVALKFGIPNTIPGRCIDLSDRGVGVILAGELIAGEAVAIELRLPNVGLPIRARAQIRYQDHLRYGLQFIGLSIEQREMIRYWTSQVPEPAVRPAIGEEPDSAPLPGLQIAPENPRRTRGIRVRRRRFFLLLAFMLALMGFGWWQWQQAWNRLERASLSAEDGNGTTPVRLSSETMDARLLYKVDPAYPEAARAAGTQGLVVLDARIAPDGTVAGVRPIAGPDLLIPAALDAVQSWRYLPYRQKDQAVEVETTISVDFRLR